jgi:thiol-disulfide isomerase/thioredoxin
MFRVLKIAPFRHSFPAVIAKLLYCPLAVPGMPSYEETQTFTVLDIDASKAGESTTLAAFRAGKPLVLDFWHTRCTKCPTAISKLDTIAPKHPDVTFAACALSLGSETEGTQEQVLDLLEGQWENLRHMYMTVAEKEAAKTQFGFTQLPFAVVFGADGTILFSGDPQGIDFATVFAPKPVAAAVAAAPNAEQQLSADLASKASVCAKEAPPLQPLGEANRAPVVLGFGNADEDF